jgi:hypothetical protein
MPRECVRCVPNLGRTPEKCVPILGRTPLMSKIRDAPPDLAP